MPGPAVPPDFAPLRAPCGPPALVCGSPRSLLALSLPSVSPPDSAGPREGVRPSVSRVRQPAPASLVSPDDASSVPSNLDPTDSFFYCFFSRAVQACKPAGGSHSCLLPPSHIRDHVTSPRTGLPPALP